MSTYTITYTLLNGTKDKISVATDSIAKTIREIEELFDSIKTPLENIDFVKE